MRRCAGGWVEASFDTTLIPCYTDLVANLTITVDDDVLKRARVRALEQGTSVNAVLAQHLRHYASVGPAQGSAVRALVSLAADNSRAGGRSRAEARGGRGWSRDDLHER